MECAPLNFPNIFAGYGVYRKIQTVVKNYGPGPGNKFTERTEGIYRGIFQQCGSAVRRAHTVKPSPRFPRTIFSFSRTNGTNLGPVLEKGVKMAVF